MRIAFINFSTVPFGPNDLLFYLAAQILASEGHHLLVSVPDWKESHAAEYQALAAAGVQIHLRPRNIRHPSFFVRTAEKVWDKLTKPTAKWQFIDAFAPDVIVICDPATYHFTSASGFLDFLGSRHTPYLTISQYNDENTSLHPYLYPRIRACFDRARHCIFVSRRNLDVARRQLCLELPQGIALHNPPKLENWSVCPYPEGTKTRMAMVARLECGVKGQALVLQALASDAWRSRDWELQLYGKGPDDNYLRDLITFLNLEGRVHLCGHVNGIHIVWEKNQLLIMASSGEGKPLALTEAMLCGRASVVTDVAGNAEIVEDGVTGFVAESATLSSISRTLELAFQQRHQWREMGLRAHESMKTMLVPPPGRQLANLIASSPA
jgi:glycosyltransferase involved in cell wall biosynthesis